MTAKAKIPKTPDAQPQTPPQKDRPDGAYLTKQEWEKSIPISWGDFQRLQEAWYAIADLGSLLKETRSDGPTNPASVLRILAQELGEAVTDVGERFDKQEGGPQ